jgi:pimeloyl-ACP methyl ester carboxylesterase
VRVRGDGVPVVFVHPALMNGHVWDDVLECADGVRAVLPDLPLGAHSGSIEPDADLSLPALARMMAAVLDHLGIGEAIVVGNDTGGAIAQQFVADHPDRAAGLLLLSCDAFENFPPRAFRWFPKALQLPGAPWLVAQVMRAGRLRRLPITFGRLVHRRLDRAEAERIMGPLWRSRTNRHDLRRAAATMTPGLTLELARRIDGFDRPVVIAWSADDPIFPPAHADRLAALFPNGHVHAPIADSLALSPLDQPAAVASALTQLLSLVAPAR